MTTAPKSKEKRSSKAKTDAGSLIRDEKLRALYKTMLRCRALEARARLLSQQDRFPSWNTGMRDQEATEVGCTIDLRTGDSVISADRDYIFKFIQGLAPGAAVASSPTVPIRTGQAAFNARDPFAVGVSLAVANRSRKNRRVVVAFSGDGSVSPRSWDEILNLAAARSLPILFVVQCFPREGAAGAKKRERAEEPSSPSQRHNVPGIPVDGNDVVAVYRVAQKSLERARSGGGPTLIECRNWSCDHGEALRREKRTRSRDGTAPGGHDPLRHTHDPIQHMEEYLSGKGLFSETWKSKTASEFARELDAVFAVQFNRSR